MSFQETNSMLEIDTASCASKSYRSNRERELDQLRLRGLQDTDSILEIDNASCASKSYKSNRERELDELRLKGLAKTRRTELKDCKYK